MDDTKPTRNYKDTLFGSLFYSCENAVENAKSLYKALTGRDVRNAEKCRLEDVLFRQFLNDVAYIMDDVFICFIEHQSTLNPNMALRLLIYLSRTYERFFTGKNLYRSTLIKIPTPEFYVLYNGKDKLQTDTLTLSSMFKAKTDQPQAELIVKVIDINYDRLDIAGLNDCKVLSDYAFVIDAVRKYNGDIEKAIKECIEKGIMPDYLKYHGSEVVNMLFEEYDAEKALEIRGQEEFEKGEAKGRAEGRAEGEAKGRAEGRAEGEAKGRAEGIVSTLVSLFKKGMLTLAQAAEEAKMSPEEFQRMAAAQQ